MNWLWEGVLEIIAEDSGVTVRLHSDRLGLGENSEGSQRDKYCSFPCYLLL